MGNKKIDIPGVGPRDVIEVGFRALHEHWNEYLLDDGTKIRMKADRNDPPTFTSRQRNVQTTTTTTATTSTEFDAFRDLTKKLLNVSKTELDEERANA